MHEENGNKEFGISGRMQGGDVKLNSNGENHNSLECPRSSAYPKLIGIEDYRG
jgi:hypothetical protein